MTQLKGANCIGIVLPDGTRMMNEDGSPLVFLWEDENGDVHELYWSIGRMGTYGLLTLPPFRADQQAEALDARTSTEASGRQTLNDGVPVATTPGGRAKSRQEKASV